MRRRASVSRGIGLVCAVAAAGVLLTACGDDNDPAQTGSAPDNARASTSPSDSGSGSDSASGSMSPSASAGELTGDQAERKALVPKAKVGYDKAMDTAVKAVSGSKPVSIELKGPADKPSWEAEVAADDGTKSTVRVDAVTGKAGAARTDSDQDTDDKKELAGLLSKAKVTPQQAAGTATGRTKGTVTSVELDDTDQGAAVWSVDVVNTGDWNKTTYDIDAADLKVLREHVDRD